jgi:hypothetical protein
MSVYGMDGEERSTSELILSGNDEKTLSLIDLLGFDTDWHF